MNKLIIAAAVAAAGFTGSAAIADVVGVSWASFQEERWKIDEAAMVAAIEAAGIHMFLQTPNRPQLSS